MGDALLQKRYTTDTLPFIQKVNHGERPQYYVENANPAIVSREVFGKVQELIKQRESHPGNQKRSYPLSGILRCPDCGRTFRRQLTRGVTYWLCSGASAGATDCIRRRVKEESVYEAFSSMLDKLKAFRTPLLGTLIHDIETMQSQTGVNSGRIAEIDAQVANLAAQNLVVTRLHTNGVLGAADFAAQSNEINAKIIALRAERKKKLKEDECDEQLDELRELNGYLEDYKPTDAFQEELFGQIVKSIRVDSNAQITFILMGGVELTESIPERGRCQTA